MISQTLTTFVELFILFLFKGKSICVSLPAFSTQQIC